MLVFFDTQRHGNAAVTPVFFPVSGRRRVVIDPSEILFH
jgi:hypothetical protein